MNQRDKIYNLLKDGLPHRTDEIQTVVYGNDHLGLARVGARCYEIKKHYDVEIKGWHDKNTPSLYWYQIAQGNTDKSEMEAKYPALFEKREEPKMNTLF